PVSFAEFSCCCMALSCCCIRSRVSSVLCARAGVAAMASARGAAVNSFFIRSFLFLGFYLNAELPGHALQAVADVLDLAADRIQLIGAFHHGLGVAVHVAHVASDFAEGGALFIGGRGNLLVQFADLLNVLEN